MMNSRRRNPHTPQLNAVAENLEKKIRDRTARVGVIGLGYVGVPLVVEMAKAGFQVTGIDIDGSKAEAVNAGKSCISNVPSETLQSLVIKGRIKATQSLAAINNLDSVNICVPTPSRESKTRDLSYVIAATEAIHNHLHPGQLIILESTIYPSTIRDLVLPILQKNGLRLGKDFFLAYSAERIDAGNKTYTALNIPKVISGMTPRCLELARLLYQQFIDRIVPVCSPEVAEMIKLLENTLRSVNIAMANEMALVCHKLGINIWEVIEMAGQISDYQMPDVAISRVMNALNEKQKSLKGSKILGLGVTYKRDTGDILGSPALEIMQGLHNKGAIVYYSDPHVPSLKIGNRILKSTEMTPEVLQSMDCVLVMTDHSAFNYEMIAAHSFLILDKRNALKDFSRSNVIRF
jgi:UDP-N-acetyl-D-glucosamine dehydrogenase